MPLGFNLLDGKNSHSAKITKRGQLTTAPLEYSTFYNAETAVDNVAVNVVGIEADKQFVITEMDFFANRDVTGQVIFQLHEAPVNSGSNISQIDKLIIKRELLKQGNMTMTGLNIIVTPGKYVNIQSDDVVVQANIGGHFINI